MYNKLNKLSWIRNKQNLRKFDPHEMNKYTLQYELLLITQQTQTYLITAQPFYQQILINILVCIN